MSSLTGPLRPPSRGLHHTTDLDVSASTAFAFAREIEKWPVWLPFLRSARVVEPDLPLRVGSEVAIASTLDADGEELYEVEAYIDGHLLALVGAYSIRRRIDVRIEGKGERSRIGVRFDYPTYGGVVGALIDRMTVRRNLDAALAEALVHFKGLVEYERSPDAVLADF
jgi:uncharacterized membrane protein